MCLLGAKINSLLRGNYVGVVSIKRAWLALVSFPAPRVGSGNETRQAHSRYVKWAWLQDGGGVVVRLSTSLDNLDSQPECLQMLICCTTMNLALSVTVSLVPSQSYMA